MNLIKYFLYMILATYVSNIYARDCPGDMVLWQSPYSLNSDCTCKGSLYKLYSKMSGNNTSYFGRCYVYPTTIPTNISNLILWLDANAPISSGGLAAGSTTATWYDKTSGNSNTGTVSPVLTSVSHPNNLTYLNNTSSVVTIALNSAYSLKNVSNFTIFIVARGNTAANGVSNIIFSTTNTSGGPTATCVSTLSINNGNSISFTNSGNTTLSLSLSGASSAYGSIFVVNSSGSGQNLYAIAPASMRMYNYPNYLLTASSSGAPLAFCANDITATYNAIFNQNYEIIMYNKSLSSLEQNKILSYLINKWSSNIY
jgi:hypothetical protein